MKTIKQYLLDECGVATPGSTMGMGNPAAPGADGNPSTVGSGDLLTAKAKKVKPRKRLPGLQ